MSAHPGVDPDQIGRCVLSLFRHAKEGGIVSVRAFYDDELAKKRKDSAFKNRSVKLNGGGLEPVIQAAVKVAEEAAAAGRPVVVAAPIATFRGSKADEKNLLEGLVLCVELDDRAAAGVTALRGPLGAPTMVVASGGEWMDPATGETGPKLHGYWRLSEPTETPAEHLLLTRARTLACELVGADGSAKNPVHCMRLPGTLHRKDLADPRLARIVEENPDSEVSLADALAELEGLALLRAEAEGEQGPAPGDDRPHAPGADPTGDDALLMACAERIANPDLDWAAWNRLGMAFWRASGGGEGGFAAFDLLSRKSNKHDADATRARWQHYATSPPGIIGVRTLIWEARKADPNFRKRKPDPEPTAGAAPEAAEAKPRTHHHDGRTLVYLSEEHVNRTAEKCARLLDAETYMRGSQPVSLVRVAELASTKIGGVEHDPGALVLVEPSPDLVQHRLDARALFMRYDARSEEWVPKACPKTLAGRVIGAASELRFRQCAGIVAVPLFQAGEIVATPGYHAPTGCYLDLRGTLPAIPAAPTKEDAAEALETLLAPFAGYVAVAEEKDRPKLRCGFAAAGMTAVTRASLDAAPAILVDANVPGAGKGKAGRALSMIATGRMPAVITEGHDAGETEKRLASALLSGTAAILLDNLQNTLASSTLESGLTEGTATIRLFGKLVDVTIPCAALVIITANNAGLRADMLRRTLPVRIVAGTDKPELREFDFDPYQRAKSMRPAIVAAGLTIARAWWRERESEDGKRIRRKTLGSFERWADLVAGAVEWLTGMNPIALIEERKAEDPAVGGERRVMAELHAMFGQRFWTAKEAVGEPAVFGASGGSGLEPEIWGGVMAFRGERPGAHAVGAWLRKRRDKVYGDYQLTGKVNGDGIVEWRVVKSRGGAGGVL